MKNEDPSGGSYGTNVYGLTAGPHAITTAPISGSTVVRKFSYDANGNQTAEINHPTTPPDTTVRSYSYNAEGMSKQLVEGSTTDNFTYGANDSLVQQNSIVYIGGVYEKDTSSGTVTKYYYVGGDRLAMRAGSTVYFLTTDQLGGTGLVTNSSGPMVSRIRYYPYGGIRTQDGSAPPTDKLFTGQQKETADIYNYQARMYNTDIGRMPQADSMVQDIGNPQSLNRYSYVVGNPASMVDPTGHSFWNQTANVDIQRNFANSSVALSYTI